MLIEIKNWKTKEVIFSYDCENNTIKKTVEKAVKNGVNLMCANLKNADLDFANLIDANLIGADLRYANLSNANLSGAYLYHAHLYCANLINADLYHANLNHADFNYVNLSDADLSKADLSEADLSNANLCRANLIHANLNRTKLAYASINGTKINYPMNVPDGEFIAWKKIFNTNDFVYVIVKLKILADSKRSRATTDKCRCNKALVLGFETIEGEPLDIKEITNYNVYKKCTYKVGEIVYPDKWDDNRWNECSHGIHFFLDRQSAVEYLI